MILPTQVISQDTREYNFSTYSTILSNELFPEIERYIKTFKHKTPINEDKAQQISTRVFEIIVKYVESKKLITPLPPHVRVFKFSNNMREAYILEITLILLDHESSIEGKIRSSIMVGKRFIIYINEIGSNKTEV
jgi:hypothetical protein